jgi:hypothetical protein
LLCIDLFWQGRNIHASSTPIYRLNLTKSQRPQGGISGGNISHPTGISSLSSSSVGTPAPLLYEPNDTRWLLFTLAILLGQMSLCSYSNCPGPSASSRSCERFNSVWFIETADRFVSQDCYQSGLLRCQITKVPHTLTAHLVISSSEQGCFKAHLTGFTSIPN